MHVLSVLPVYICTTCMPSVHGGQKTASDHLNWSFMDGWERPHGCWKLNQGLQQEQQVL